MTAAANAAARPSPASEERSCLAEDESDAGPTVTIAVPGPPTIVVPARPQPSGNAVGNGAPETTAHHDASERISSVGLRARTSVNVALRISLSAVGLDVSRPIERPDAPPDIAL